MMIVTTPGTLHAEITLNVLGLLHCHFKRDYLCIYLLEAFSPLCVCCAYNLCFINTHPFDRKGNVLLHIAVAFYYYVLISIVCFNYTLIVSQ